MTKVTVFTSTRADYGILSPLIKRLNTDTYFECRLFVTGTHLALDHGLTIAEIKKDGLNSYYEVPINLTDDAKISHLAIMGESIPQFAKALTADLPDVAVVLGDRFEALSFAIACNGLGIPLVHLHGGEVTSGALDDGYRHCITKLSYLHMVSSKSYRKRVIALGENPERVHDVGALGVDNILHAPLIGRIELEKILNLKFRKNLVAFTYHPETANPEVDMLQISALLEALGKKVEAMETTVVFTRANADHGNQKIHEMIEEFSRKYSQQTAYVKSLGMVNYLSLIKWADAVVGNSSSGIIEAPALGTPTVNVGDRQKGREMAPTIINVSGNSESILVAIEKAFQMKSAGITPSKIFGDGQSAQKMIEILKKEKFGRFPRKDFYDIFSESRGC